MSPQGTKHLADIFVDIDWTQTSLWEALDAEVRLQQHLLRQCLESRGALWMLAFHCSQSGDCEPSRGRAAQMLPSALAHRGFQSRARGVPIEALYLHARARRLRLVLCGASNVVQVRFGGLPVVRMPIHGKSM